MIRTKALKMSLSAAALTLGAAIFALPGLARASTWELDSSHSRFGFSVRHLMVSNVRGDFKKVAGKIELDDKDPTKSTFEINVETASIDTDDAKRDEHLRSADFFDVTKFPAMSYKSKSIKKAGKGYTVQGDLTIKGVTKPVTLTIEGPAKAIKDPWGNTKSGATVTGKLNRKDFGLTWNAPIEAGGVVVGDEVKLEIEVELLQKPAA